MVETDAAYKAAFITGTDTLSIRVNSLAPTNVGASFDGTSWSATGGEGWTFQAKGREIDLRVRITSSVGDVLIESYGIYYHEQGGVTATAGEFQIDRFQFTGDENRTSFPLVNIQNPIPGLVEVFDNKRGQVYLNGPDTYLIDGNTLTFQPDFFDFPGEDIDITVRQIKAGIIDNSDTNAANIADIFNQLIDIGDQLESVSDSMVLPKIAVPFTTIANRGMIPDLSLDLKPRFGVDRIMTQEAVELQSEVGPNGGRVFGV